jgi:hypothetical protein
LPQLGGFGRHRSRKDASNVRMMATRRHVEHDLSATGAVKDGSNNLDMSVYQ